MAADSTRGETRERSLGRDAYFSDGYFSMRQLGSVAHQLHHIWLMRPSNVLEIGPGHGFVSACLRRAGIPVTTVDVNPQLEPDICARLQDLPQHLHAPFDLVVCCEVLEHMPLEDLDVNLDRLKSAGRRLLMTLPNSRYSLGFGGLLVAPRDFSHTFDLTIDIPVRRPIAGGPHFWEVGSGPGCGRKDIVRRLRRRYARVEWGRFALNPYHLFFKCESVGP